MRGIHVLLLNVVCMVVLYIAVQAGFGTTVYDDTSEPQVAAATTVRATPDTQSTNPLLIEINKVRNENGLTLLTENEQAMFVAKARVSDMVINQYYAHTSPKTGAVFSDYFEYVPAQSCENLQLGYSGSVSDTVQEWMDSNLGHRECLLNPNLRYIGYSSNLFMNIDTDEGMSSSYVTAAILTSN